MTPPTPSQTHPLRLYKCEKLCSVADIDRLFSNDTAGVSSFIAYPLRVVWRHNTAGASATLRFLVSIPKKRVRHAVDRVTMRRRVREAYRLNRNEFKAEVPEGGLDVVFTYVGSGLMDYRAVERAVCHSLHRIARELATSTSGDDDSSAQ